MASTHPSPPESPRLAGARDRILVLGSSSPYRRALLDRLRLDFRTAVPDVDERPLAGERPEALVSRLALAKAGAVAARFSAALVIGSDQVAVRKGTVLGKPGSRANAIEQLRRASGHEIQFLTGLCVLDSSTDGFEVDVVPYAVVFRKLTEPQIERYVDAESPLDCAGSFKSEGLGITLFERMHGDDPTALMGLPLIQLVRMLGKFGLELP